MRRTVKYLCAILVMGAALLIAYFYLPSGSGDDSTEPETVPAASLSETELARSEQIRQEKGTPKKGGMAWRFADENVAKRAYESVPDWKALTVFEVVKENMGDAYEEKLRRFLKLDKEEQKLGETDDGYYYEEAEGNPNVCSKDLDLLVRELRMGVWMDSVNFGKLEKTDNSVYEPYFSFNGYPWKRDVYATPLINEKEMELLTGFETMHDMFFQFDEQDHLTVLDSFSCEIREKPLSNLFSSYDQFLSFVEKIMNQYQQEEKEAWKRREGNEDIPYFYFEDSTVENITVCYCREFRGEGISSFVPVLVLEGEKDFYYEEDDFWDVSERRSYAISLDTGKLYDWRWEDDKE